MAEHSSPSPSQPLRIAFVYLGRRGALARFTLDLAQAALADGSLDPLIVVSRSNELFPAFAGLGDAVESVDTFAAGAGVLLRAYRLPFLIARFRRLLVARRTQVVVVLLSHIWSPIIAPFIMASGRKYVVIVHDAVRHPGDPTAFVSRWISRDAVGADLIVTLSGSVTNSLRRQAAFADKPIATLFLPTFGADDVATRKAWNGTRPLRLLFFGRILPYKGLPLFAEAIGILLDRGVKVEASVVGEGFIPPNLIKRFVELGVNVRNEWLADNAIAAVFAAHDVVVLSHIEASQSGVASVAQAYGLPIVATPVGGLPEQVQNHTDGLISAAATAEALGDAIASLAADPTLCDRLARGALESRRQKSMSEFLKSLIGAVGEAGS